MCVNLCSVLCTPRAAMPAFSIAATATYVLTVPANWSDEAKHIMRQCAHRAGITPHLGECPAPAGVQKPPTCAFPNASQCDSSRSHTPLWPPFPGSHLLVELPRAPSRVWHLVVSKIRACALPPTSSLDPCGVTTLSVSPHHAPRPIPPLPTPGSHQLVIGRLPVMSSTWGCSETNPACALLPLMCIPREHLSKLEPVSLWANPSFLTPHDALPPVVFAPIPAGSHRLVIVHEPEAAAIALVKEFWPYLSLKKGAVTFVCICVACKYVCIFV